MTNVKCPRKSQLPNAMWVRCRLVAQSTNTKIIDYPGFFVFTIAGTDAFVTPLRPPENRAPIPHLLTGS
jgi:hypothetical protein